MTVEQIKFKIMSDSDKNYLFNTEKIAEKIEIPIECLSDLELKIGQTADNFIQEELTAMLVGKIYSNTIDERELEYYLNPPSFFDWLFRKKRKVVFDFKAKDLLLNPPVDNCIRVYEISDGKVVKYDSRTNNH